MTTNLRPTTEDRAWAERVMGRSSSPVTEEQRRAAIRREIEVEVDAALIQGRSQREREAATLQFAHSQRHARAVTATRDRDPANPVGTERRASDGTVWVRKS